MKTLNEESIATVIDEFQEVELGDERLRKRVAQTAKSLAASPDKSFPRAMVSDAETEGFYRLMVNPRVSGQELLQPHFKATLERAKSAAALGDGTALCMHDTTSFSYQGERSGLGPISGKGQGYLAHVALVVANSEGRIPFGVGGVCTWAREEKQKNKTTYL